MIRNVIGVDPGKSGGVVLLSENGGIISTYALPAIGKEIDLQGIHHIFKQITDTIKHNPIEVFIEDVHAISGSAAGATFNFGRNLGVLHGIITALGLPMVFVKPKEWQAKSWRGVKPQTKRVDGRNKVDTKKTSEVAAKRLFPETDFRATPQSTKAHDGIVDAALIAHYGMKFHYA